MRPRLNRQRVNRSKLKGQNLRQQKLKRPESERPELERQEVRSAGRASLEDITVNMCCPQPPGQALSHGDDPTESFGHS